VRCTGLFKSKSNRNKKDSGHQDERKKAKYVYLYSKKAVFLVTGEPRKNKYSYGVPIIPLQGFYLSSKDRHIYTANELNGYFVVLNIDEEDAEVLRGKKVVVMGYNEDETLFVPADGSDKNGDSEA
jgi:hypothetical protein